MLATIAKARLEEELRKWRLMHPAGFSARPVKINGVDQIKRWECQIPGKQGTSWGGREYTIVLEFPDNYPAQPPMCRFTPPIFHLNVFTSGTVCLGLLGLARDKGGWKPSVTVDLILVSIQRLLYWPNETDPHNDEAFNMYSKSKRAYYARIKENPFCSVHPVSQVNLNNQKTISILACGKKISQGA